MSIVKPPLPTRTLQDARELRSRMTDAERRLWLHLRAGRLNGYKFRRQHPIPPYIADFCCIEARLIVELDGSQHTENSDRGRTEALQAQGWRMLRFWNHDALMQTDAMLEAILNALAARTLSPTPLPGGEGL
jgi:very-short-patch-repair endonuclease